MRFSRIEIRDLVAAWLLISIAFAILMTEGIIPNLQLILVAALTVGIGFLVHELAHKYVAQRLRKFAEFRASYPMLGLAVLMSMGGFLIAAPGAVIVSGFVNKRENGMIGAAGPISNIALCLLALPLFLLAVPGSALHLIAGLAFGINALLALFNMIPLWMFDGAKIIAWNKPMYFGIVAVGALFLVVSSFLGVF